MIPQIVQALSQGFTSKQIIDFIAKKFPEHEDKIKNAIKAGFTVDQVLNFLGKSKGKEKTDSSNSTTEYENTRNIGIKRNENINKGALAAGALGATTLAAPMAQYALQRVLPNSLKSLVTGGTAGSLSQMQTKEQSSQTPPLNVDQNISQPVNPMQPKGISSPREYLEKAGLKDKVDQLLKAGNPPEAVAAALNIGTKGKKATGEIDPELLTAIDAYSKEKLRDEAMQPEGSLPQEKLMGGKLAKNETVASPHGIGEVKEIRNGKAIIDIDGKKHQVNEDELESEPEEVKTSKIEVDLNSIPENLRSAPLNEVYAPGHRKHITIKYNSDVGKEKEKRYIYYKKDGSPVDESIIEKLRIGSQIPVTSGKNFWGGWNANTQDSRGTVAYHELTSMAQKLGEEDDPSKPYWFEEEEEIFTHGYVKEPAKELRRMSKGFNEEEKRKKKKSR